MSDLTPAALVIAQAILGPTYHPSKVTDPGPYLAAAAALHDAGMLTCTRPISTIPTIPTIPPAALPGTETSTGTHPRAPMIDEATWWSVCEQLWPELFTAGPVVSVTIAHLARAVYTQAASDVDVERGDALGVLREWFRVRGVPVSAATRIAADVVTAHDVLRSMGVQSGK